MYRKLVIKYEEQRGLLYGTLMVEGTRDVLVRVVADGPFLRYEHQQKAIKRKIAEYLTEQLLNIMEE